MVEDIWDNSFIISPEGEWSLTFNGDSHDDYKLVCKAICKFGYAVKPNNRITLRNFAKLIKLSYPNDESIRLYVNVLNRYESVFDKDENVKQRKTYTYK